MNCVRAENCEQYEKTCIKSSIIPAGKTCQSSYKIFTTARSLSALMIDTVKDLDDCSVQTHS